MQSAHHHQSVTDSHNLKVITIIVLVIHLIENFQAGEQPFLCLIIHGFATTRVNFIGLNQA